MGKKSISQEYGKPKIGSQRGTENKLVVTPIEMSVKVNVTGVENYKNVTWVGRKKVCRHPLHDY